MTTIEFFTPHYIENPRSFKQSATNFVEGYFDLHSSSMLMTALKVISYITLIIPVIILVAKVILRITDQKNNSTLEIPKELAKVIASTPKFRGYQIGQGTKYENTTLTSVTIRPANLFFNALFGPESHTLPGSGRLFQFTRPFSDLRNQIMNADPNQVIEISAKNVEAHIRTPYVIQHICDLADLYGEETFRISYEEIRSILNSQKIYVASFFPLPFYQALKKALLQDKIVTLPVGRIQDVTSTHCHGLIQDARRNPENYGFPSQDHLHSLLDLTFYQLGSLVIKSEDFHIFLDGNGKIRARNVNENDQIRLINACGIRDVHTTNHNTNQIIMKAAFQTALEASESGYAVFPAVGMGVWGGDPNLYWRAFLDAIVTHGTQIEKIFINPGHQKTRSGQFSGCSGEELQQILDQYKTRYTNDSAALANLKKVVNLFDQKTDLIHLASNLKRTFPNKIVSLFNASDPDVTLGYHVGEYVNNLGHAATTEENYTALGTNGLCFEEMTAVHQDPFRTIQQK